MTVLESFLHFLVSDITEEHRATLTSFADNSHPVINRVAIVKSHNDPLRNMNEMIKKEV